MLHKRNLHRLVSTLVSTKSYDNRAGLLVYVPVTNQINGYPFEVILTGLSATGAALADQVKSLDWQSRQTERKGSATPLELAEIKAKAEALLGVG